MKIIIPGGTGEVGTVLARAFHNDGHDVVVLSRSPKQAAWRFARWDGETLGDWTNEIEGADVVINLAGRSVNCRYNEQNRREMMESRLKSTRILGEAIGAAADPPEVWLQMSTATIYSHRFDAPNDETDGVIGGNEPDAPAKWKFSIDVATAWEEAARQARTPQTRKVLMRLSILMSPERGGTLDLLITLVRFGLGGKAGSGRQYISWIHDRDFVRSVYWLIENDEISGPVNLAAPNPLPNAEFMRALRSEYGMPFGLPAFEWQLAIATFAMRSESELVLKSRRVVPKVLTESGFKFEFPEWDAAAKDLVQRWRNP
jgi:uncharacterized protein (TIGR01777 family)